MQNQLFVLCANSLHFALLADGQYSLVSLLVPTSSYFAASNTSYRKLEEKHPAVFASAAGAQGLVPLPIDISGPVMDQGPVVLGLVGWSHKGA